MQHKRYSQRNIRKGRKGCEIMKALFVFDTVLQVDEKNNYWGQTLTYDFFKKRYLPMFDEMIISTRVKNKDKNNN